MGGTLEKPQLINFIAKVMEDSGFRVYKNFKTSQRVIDIYAVLHAVILLDKGQILPIDSKFSLENYNRMVEASGKERE